jgi:hypothetical protein
MDRRESDSSEESSVPKSAIQPVRQLNGDSPNEIIVVYEYDEHNGEEYDLAMDGILLNGCSQYLFKFSIIVFPIIFLIVIVIGIFETDERNNELRRKACLSIFLIIRIFFKNNIVFIKVLVFELN